MSLNHKNNVSFFRPSKQDENESLYKASFWTTKTKDSNDPSRFYEVTNFTSGIFKSEHGLLYAPSDQKTGYLISNGDLWTYKLNEGTNKVEGIDKISEKIYTNAVSIDCWGDYLFILYIQELSLQLDIYYNGELMA